MFFFIDQFDQSVEVFPSLDKLAKHILAKLKITWELGQDPVQLAQKSLGNRGKVVGLSGAFKLIAAEEEDKKAREWAQKFYECIERARK